MPLQSPGVGWFSPIVLAKWLPISGQLEADHPGRGQRKSPADRAGRGKLSLSEELEKLQPVAGPGLSAVGTF